MTAPWPYEPFPDPSSPPDLPSWDCPGGTCVCHAAVTSAAKRHTIALYDHEGVRMPGARCRVFRNGVLLNADCPNADGDGELHLRLPRGTTLLWVEWAPATTPRSPKYPYRRQYFVDRDVSREEAARRRLHHIGFSARRDLSENIVDFQLAYHREPTGRLDDVEALLVSYHDQGTLPPLPPPREGAMAHGLVAPSSPPPRPPGDPAPTTPLANPTFGILANLVRTVRVTVRLQIGFLLLRDHFADPTRDIDTPQRARVLGHPRFGRTAQFVHGATLAATVPSGGTVQRTADDAFDILVPHSGEEALYAFTVEPPPGQLNETDRAAGPDLTAGRHRREVTLTVKQIVGPASKDITRYEVDAPELLFRRFTLGFMLDPSGNLLPDRLMCLPFVRPAFAVPRLQGGEITVFWRPDWIRAPAISTRLKPEDGFAVPILKVEARPVTESPFDAAQIGQTGRLPCIVLHQTDDNRESVGENIAAFTDPAVVESVHYVVDLDGHAVKLVHELHETNHADPSVWATHDRVNGRSIGIEIVHSDFDPPPPGSTVRPSHPRPFPDEQMQGVTRLLRELLRAFPSILPPRVLGHAEVGTDRWTTQLTRNRVGDPGMLFDWPRLEGEGLARDPRWTPPTDSDPVLYNVRPGESHIQSRHGPIDVGRIKGDLATLGYSVSADNAPGTMPGASAPSTITPTWDDAFTATLKAFQARYFSGARIHDGPQRGQFNYNSLATLTYATVRLLAFLLRPPRP
ncbi:MAG: N-acetylmuramoyl-L-alanine amidase [Myxococcales bacterium]|nr:N-acetylmuramoyl-L-alanine amidase [Myxococcales bacterium]